MWARGEKRARGAGRGSGGSPGVRGAWRVRGTWGEAPPRASREPVADACLIGSSPKILKAATIRATITPHVWYATEVHLESHQAPVAFLAPPVRPGPRPQVWLPQVPRQTARGLRAAHARLVPLAQRPPAAPGDARPAGRNRRPAAAR